MDVKELEKSLNDMTAKLEQKQNEAIKEAQKQFDEKYASVKDVTEFKELNEKNIEAIKAGFDKNIEEIKKGYDDAIMKAQKQSGNNGKIGYIDAMQDALEKNHDLIKSVRKGAGTDLHLKDMTIAGNLTGNAVATYDLTAKMIPSQKVNFSDLVSEVQSATGIWKIYRQAANTGSFGVQSTENTAKSQIDYNFTEVTFNADYIAGFTKYSKQMQDDLPFLQTFLPQALRTDYYKQENSEFYTDLAAAATVSTQSGERIEQILLDIGVLEDADYDANGVTLRPSEWAQIAITKPSDYSLPSVVTFINGQLVINGIPVFKASWMPADKYLVGDWTQANKVSVGGLNLNFYEQDVDNVQKNMITARLEQRTVLAINRPDAFILGDFTPST